MDYRLFSSENVNNQKKRVIKNKRWTFRNLLQRRQSNTVAIFGEYWNVIPEICSQRQTDLQTRFSQYL